MDTVKLSTSADKTIYFTMIDLQSQQAKRNPAG